MRHIEFFDYARERYSIYLKRQAGQPPPWTSDPILQAHRFCNVFRESDTTTIWLRQNVREKLPVEQLMLATVTFRFFNRMTSGDVLFKQPGLTGETPWETFLRTGSGDAMRAALRSAYPEGPWVTGSFMMRSPDGMDKLDGTVYLCEQFHRKARWRSRTEWMLRRPGDISLEETNRWLETLQGFGGFLAYEAVTDFRHTPLLDKAPDIMTWAHPGPGAGRGLNYLHDRINPRPRSPSKQWDVRISEAQAVSEMQELLRLSQDSANWPSEWPPFEMREIEHTLCEVLKYARMTLLGRPPRQRFRGG